MKHDDFAGQAPVFNTERDEHSPILVGFPSASKRRPFVKGHIPYHSGNACLHMVNSIPKWRVGMVWLLKHTGTSMHTHHINQPQIGFYYHEALVSHLFLAK